MQVTNNKNIDRLNSFLRGELSAVETYRQAMEKLKDETGILHELEACRESHQRRAEALTAEIRRLGGIPAQDSGAWGSFAKLVEGSAKLFGKKAAIAALEEGEDHGRNDYQRDVKNLDPSLQSFVVNAIMPEQQKTHDVVSRLQRQV